MNEQWNEALDQVKDEYLAEAVSYQPKRHWIKIVGTLAAMVVLVFSWSVLRPDPLVTDVIMDTTTGSIATVPTETQEKPPASAEDPVFTTPPTSSPLPQDTTQAPTLPPQVETTPTPTLPLPEETKPIPTLPLPEETTPPATKPATPTPSTPPVIQNTPPVNITSGTITSPHLLSLQNLVAAPSYPSQPKCPDPADYSSSSQLYYAQEYWKIQLKEIKVKSPDNVRDLDSFMQSAMTQFLSGSGNQVCSPLNMYFALATLAETCGSTARQQILSLLGHSSIESLRAQAKQLWQAHFFDNGTTTSLMANSLWLDENYKFNQSTVSTLATDYFASVFHGDLGSDSINQQLSTWLNTQTGGLLSDYTQNIQLDPATVFCLASTTYFSADWDNTFSKTSNTQGIFHCEGYDLNTDFMNETFTDYYYFYDPMYSAVYLPLADGHKMWLILPDEGYTPADLLRQGNYYQMITDPWNWAGKGIYKVILSVPKFDISAEQDLRSGLKAMGLTEMFKSSANFSPITNAPITLGEISHAARVCIDEEGVIAAAYTLIQAPGAAAPRENEEVYFTLDRPFLFVITGSDYLPLFGGVVSKP